MFSIQEVYTDLFIKYNITTCKGEEESYHSNQCRYVTSFNSIIIVIVIVYHTPVVGM